MRKVVILLLVLFSASLLRAQVLSSHKTVIRNSKTQRVERVNYQVPLYEFADSAILLSTIRLLSFDPAVDTIRIKSDKVTYILTMRFEQGGGDTIVCHASYSESPYIYDDLQGCCLIAGYYVQIIGLLPPFLVPTKETVSFSYVSYKLCFEQFELEEMGDDSAPHWVIGFSGNDVTLIKYYPYRPIGD